MSEGRAFGHADDADPENLQNDVHVDCCRILPVLTCRMSCTTYLRLLVGVEHLGEGPGDDMAISVDQI